MTKVHPIQSEETRYDEASLWIERLGEGLTQEEELELQSWLTKDPANPALLEKMARLWDKMDSLSRLSTLLPQPVSTMESNRHRAPYSALAASVVLGLSMLLLWNWSDDRGITLQIAQRPAEIFYETAIGGQQVNQLEDGTIITLNTGSRIGVRYTSKARVLNLEYGEVHVQVSKDPARPLSVLVGDRVVQAVGTAFNIEIKPGREIELVVTEGSVRVGELSPMDGVEQNNVKIVLPSSAAVVTAGQELVMDDEVAQASPISEAEIQVKLSWQKGNLIFAGEPLAEVVKEVERYTGVEFVFLDENLKETHVSGFFKAGDVEGMLAVLKENFGIEFQRESNNRVLLYGI